MQTTRLKIDPWKDRCDRCQQLSTPIHECSFAFRHPFAYWKGLYSAATGKRLTNRRKGALAAPANPEAVPFDWKPPPLFWIKLCEPCWEEVSQPWDGFPIAFYAEVLLPSGVRTWNALIGETVVPTKRPLTARGLVPAPLA